MHRLIGTLAWFCVIAILGSARITIAQVYVAANGNDLADGSKAAPLATLAKAVAVARDKGIKHILVGGGSYYDTAVELTAADSGLTIEGASGQDVVLIGGVPLDGWAADGPFMAAKLPAGRAWDVRMLQVNGRLCNRARYPAKGVLQCLNKFDVRWLSSTDGGWQRKPTAEELSTLIYKDGDLPSDLELGNAEMTVYHSWDESCVGLCAQDKDAHTLMLSPPATYPPGAFHHHEYVLWNIRQGMTQPGQWYWDRVGGRIVYWPREGEDLAKMQAIVPTRQSIIQLRGTKDAPVKDIILRNLQLQVATVPLMAAGYGADKYPGAVNLASAQNVLIDQLTVQQVAGHGINTSLDAADACTGITVENCTISDCGAGGIYVGGAKTIIRNNLVKSIGRFYPSAIGIHRWGNDCLISHNEVHDTPYSAMAFSGQRVVIENNLLYDCMKVLQDGAAIYMFDSHNCIVRGNVVRAVRDTGNAGAGASAYYLDERCQDCTVESNLALNVLWPMHNHMARNNTVQHNIFISRSDMRVTFYRSTGYTIDGNVWYAAGKVRLEMGEGYQWHNNIIFSRGGKIETALLDMYVPRPAVPGAPGDTITDDPGFVDLPGGDCHFRDDSLAAKLGLKGLDAKMAGRQEK